MKSIKKLLARIGLVTIVSTNQVSAIPSDSFPPKLKQITFDDVNSNSPFKHIVCTKIDYQEPFQPMNNRGEETRYFEIRVPKGNSLEKIANDLVTVNTSRIFDTYMKQRFFIGKDSYFWRDFKVGWQDLYKQNRDVIGENPDLIKPEMVLRYISPTIILPGSYIRM